MSESNPFRVYVSHLFCDDPEYLRVFEFLEGVDRFFYINTSKPEDVPESGGLDALKDAYIRQIRECEAMIVLPEQYMQNESLINYQIDVGNANSKPVIVIKPFGGVLGVPTELERRAKEVIEWNNREIADALRRQARHEDTSKWDVIDFPGFDPD